MTHDPTALEVEQVARAIKHAAKTILFGHIHSPLNDEEALRCAKAAITALSQARDAALEEGWQDIAMLPNHTPALLWTRLGNEEDDPPAPLPGYADDNGNWWMAIGLQLLEEPTHWRPLPSPPA